MTDADKKAFDQAINRLCVSLRSPALDVAEKRVYYEKLKDLEIEFIAAAAETLADSAQFFPKTSEWRAAAIKVERDRRTAQIEFLRNLPAPLCSTCGDTTWAPVKDGPAVRPCACRPIRRLELLGRRPLPMLPESTIPADPQAAEKIRAIAAKLVKPIPQPSPVAMPTERE
jgi:hypothetical protein